MIKNHRHEEFLNQFIWIDDDHIKGMHKPRNTKAGFDIVFSKNLAYRGFKFKIHLFKSTGMLLDHGREHRRKYPEMFGYSESIWELYNRSLSKERFWYFKHNTHTRRESLERYFCSLMSYIDFILDSSGEEFEQVGREFAKRFKKTQREARALVQTEKKNQTKTSLTIPKQRLSTQKVTIKHD